MKEFLTFKSGKFYFCDVFDTEPITPLLVKASILNETIADLPILPEFASRLEPDIKFRSIAGTAMIEGNAIVDDDVRRIAAGEDIDIYTQKDKQEIKNLIAAYEWVSDFEPSKEPFTLTESLIKHLHEIITRDVQHPYNVPGQYRNGIVYVGDTAHGGKYTPPKILADVQNLMSEFIDWINHVDAHPFIRGALTHYHFSLIHPFWDGNGRTARLLEALLLQTANIRFVPSELSNYYYRNVDDYYRAFSTSIKLKKNVTPFLKFMLEAAVESLQSIKETIVFFIRKLVLKDYYAIKKKRNDIIQRQYDLLMSLLENPIAFMLKDLHTKHPFAILYNHVSIQTARRDLKKLTRDNFLTMLEDGSYKVNIHALG